jgi:hypothetical protein
MNCVSMSACPIISAIVLPGMASLWSTVENVRRNVFQVAKGVSSLRRPARRSGAECFPAFPEARSVYQK